MTLPDAVVRRIVSVAVSGGGHHCGSTVARATPARRGLVAGLGRDHLGDAQGELLVDRDDLAAGDEAPVDEQVGRLAGEPVERDDGAPADAEGLPDRHPRPADLDHEIDRDVEDEREIGRAGARHGSPAQVGQGHVPADRIGQIAHRC